jgi:hypothetical protein
MTHLLQLPQAIQAAVCSYLLPLDFFRKLVQVCRAWSKLQVPWVEVRLGSVECLSLRVLVKLIARVPPRPGLRSLVIDNQHLASDHEWSFLQNITTIPTLRSLCLENLTTDDLASLCDYFEADSFLELEQFGLELLCQQLPLSLTRFWSLVPSALPRARLYFSVKHCWGFHVGEVVEPSVLSRLDSLSLFNIDIRVEELIRLLHGAVNLRNLELNFIIYEDLDVGGVIAHALHRYDPASSSLVLQSNLGRALTGVSHLLVSLELGAGQTKPFNMSVLDGDLASLRHLPFLADLKLFNCNKLTDRGLASVNQATIRSLTVVRCDSVHFTSRALMFPNLEILHLNLKAERPNAPRALALVAARFLKLVEFTFLVGGTRWASADLQLLSRLPRLQSLTLNLQDDIWTRRSQAALQKTMEPRKLRIVRV